MALLLCIETATEVCSVALAQDEHLLSLQETHQAFQHASQLTNLIAKCLDASIYTIRDLSAIAVSSGPGSYTGLRVGWSTAKGIAYALQIPLIAVDTLQALADGARRVRKKEEELYCPMIDARRMEVYTAIYDARGKAVVPATNLVITEGTHALQAFWQTGQAMTYCGNGAEKGKEYFPAPHSTILSLECSAQYLSPLAFEAWEQKKFVDIAYAEPLYLKPPNITTPKKIL